MLLAAGGCATPASAGVVSQTGHPAARDPSLSAAERRAITIASVNVTGDGSLGVFVRVTFQGDIERYLGQGHLRRGLLALALMPAAGGEPAGLVDSGSGSAERVLRFTPARPAGVVRHGSQVTFYVAGAHLGRFPKIELKVFATSSGHATWRQILAARPAAQTSLRVDSGPLTCSQLAALAGQLGSLGGASDARRQEQALSTIRAAVGRARLTACAAPPSASPPAPTTTPTVAAASTPVAPASAPPVVVVQTDAALSQQLASQPGLSFSAAPPSGEPVIAVDDQVAYQSFGGLGAALTDSAAWLIYNRLSSADRTTVMQELFGASGIHLNFLRDRDGRVGRDDRRLALLLRRRARPASPIPTLTDFSIAHDTPYIIPTLQQARSINPGLEILANPWSPPGWMKNNDSLGNQQRRGHAARLRLRAARALFREVLQAYASAGRADRRDHAAERATVGRPDRARDYPGLTLPEPDEAQFIAQDLAPALAQRRTAPEDLRQRPELGLDRLRQGARVRRRRAAPTSPESPGTATSARRP